MGDDDHTARGPRVRVTVSDERGRPVRPALARWLAEAAPRGTRGHVSVAVVRDVTSDLQIRNPQVRVSVDRERAAAFGVSVSQVEGGLYDAYGARQVSTIYTAINQYWVILELLPQYQRDFDAFRLLSIRSPSSSSVTSRGQLNGVRLE